MKRSILWHASMGFCLGAFFSSFFTPTYNYCVTLAIISVTFQLADRKEKE